MIDNFWTLIEQNCLKWLDLSFHSKQKEITPLTKGRTGSFKFISLESQVSRSKNAEARQDSKIKFELASNFFVVFQRYLFTHKHFW